MKKLLAAFGICTALFLGSVAPAVADDAAAQSQQSEDDDNGEMGLWGLAGLLGLAGLAGLKRRDRTDARYDDDRYSGTAGRTVR